MGAVHIRLCYWAACFVGAVFGNPNTGGSDGLKCGNGTDTAQPNRIHSLPVNAENRAQLCGGKNFLAGHRQPEKASFFFEEHRSPFGRRVTRDVAGTNRPIRALFVFGDSSSDVGNNLYDPNAVSTRADIYPYGIDYMPQSGRLSNGKIIVDYLAEYLGLPFSPPPNKAANSDARFGLNFASSGATATDIRDGPGFNLSSQLADFSAFMAAVATAGGGAALLPSLETVQSALFLVAIGGNDYTKTINRTLESLDQGLDLSAFRGLFRAAVGNITAGIERLISLGASRLVVSQVTALGCTPGARQTLGVRSRRCVGALSAFNCRHNRLLGAAISRLRRKHPNVTLIERRHFEEYRRAVLRPQTAGFKVGFRACCGAPPPLFSLGQCGRNYTLPNGTVVPWSMCPNRDDYFFWDALHATQAANKWAAQRMWVGPQSLMFPMNLSTLVQSL